MKAAVLAAAFLFSSPNFAQTKPAAPVIQTPSTQNELQESEVPAPRAEAEPKVPATPATEENKTVKNTQGAPAPRRLHQHSIGLGLGQTFLLGKYGDYGEDKITTDFLYTYAASYSFDVLVNAHYSNHTDGNEKINIMGLAGAIKSRLFEFDNFSPYALGGLGFYAPRAKREVSGDDEWSTRKVTFGINFGGGVDLRLNDQWTVGALGQMHWPFKVKQNDGPDLKGYYFKLLLTLAYSF